MSTHKNCKVLLHTCMNNQSPSLNEGKPRDMQHTNYQASLVVLGWPGVEDCYLMQEDRHWLAMCHIYVGCLSPLYNHIHTVETQGGVYYAGREEPNTTPIIWPHLPEAWGAPCVWRRLSSAAQWRLWDCAGGGSPQRPWWQPWHSGATAGGEAGAQTGSPLAQQDTQW